MLPWPFSVSPVSHWGKWRCTSCCPGEGTVDWMLLVGLVVVGQGEAASLTQNGNQPMAGSRI